MTDAIDSIEAATSIARSGLMQACARLFPDSPVHPRFEGQLLRPVLSLAAAAPDVRTDHRFWYAALAVQLAHEASLVHDDVVDNASTRRDRPTTFASKGAAAAVLEGDLLLTAAYVAAAATGSPAFVTRFARAVLRTVVAERTQGAALGRPVNSEHYETIASGKAGELMGCALAASSMILGGDGVEHGALGREIGLLYQMMDDFLDYCPKVQTGKPPLGDYEQGRWTWPLNHLENARLGQPITEILSSFHASTASTGSPSAMCGAAEWLRARIGGVATKTALQFPHSAILPEMLQRWSATVDDALRLEQRERVAGTRRALIHRVGELNAHSGEMGYLAHHSRSFRFASTLLPHELRHMIARVYAFCRFTDNLADEPARDGMTRTELLDDWLQLAETSYNGTSAALPLLDITMREMREASVPFSHVVDLCRGMRMDIDGTSYSSLGELRVYTYRVAGVVGLWIAQLSGVREPSALANAERMGHAMQMTNILRDVGEDWKSGRLYIPQEVLARHGLERSDIAEMVAGTRPIPASYRDMIRELIQLARDDYDAAFAWLPSLPEPLQPGMAVAAGVYEAIHDALRRNDYDNIHARASTSLVRKVGIASHALRSLRRARKTSIAISTGPAESTLMNHGWQA